MILRFSIVFFILLYVSLVQCQTFCAGVTVNVCEDHLIYFIPLFTDRYSKKMTHYGLNLTELADK